MSDEKAADEWPKQMRQVAPYPTVLAELVEQLEYRPGWRFDLVDIDRGQGRDVRVGAERQEAAVRLRRRRPLLIRLRMLSGGISEVEVRVGDRTVACVTRHGAVTRSDVTIEVTGDCLGHLTLPRDASDGQIIAISRRLARAAGTVS